MMSKGTETGAGRRIGAFAHDEMGTLTIFGLVMLFLMVMVGGIAVDVMRYEVRRTQLQNTLDRSTLAAASLKDALDAVAADFQSETGNTVTISYAGSNALAKQIIEGAPADIFISAAVNWMDEVEKAGLVVSDTREDLLGNTLVLVAPKQAKAKPLALRKGM